jgi:hypothetical protein
MTLNRRPNTLWIVLLWSALLVGCGSNRSEPTPVAVVEPAVAQPAAAAIDPYGVQGKVEVHGSPQGLRYDVTFDVTSGVFQGNARIERQEEFWPPSFEIRIRGRNQPHQFVTLEADGFEPIAFLNEGNEKRVDFYDERGKHLDHSIESAFRIESEGTAEGLKLKVNLPERARSMRGMTIKYFTSGW